MLKDNKNADGILNTIVSFEPLSHFAAFERYLLNPTEANKTAFGSMIRNEQPIESYSDLADSYYKNGCVTESEEVLQLSPVNALVDYKFAFLHHLQGKPYQDLLTQANTLTPAFVFPFRNNDEEVLQWVIKQSNSWKPKYFLALLYRDRNRIEESKKLFTQCGNKPDFAPFYAACAAMQMGTTELPDLMMAVKLDKSWRYNKLLSEYYLTQQQYKEALTTIEPFYKAHPGNYIIGILYAKTLLLNKRYNDCGKLLAGINILPFEGATIGRELYRETELMQAVQKLKAQNYAAALSFIAEAKKWPANLGVGKPYAENVDERLEDWMSYQCYLKQGNAGEANRCLQKIIAFKPKIENTVNNFLPANDLVTAWAIEKLQDRAAATNWLNDELKQYPNDKVLQWVKTVFDSGTYQQTELSDAGIRILKEVM